MDESNNKFNAGFCIEEDESAYEHAVEKLSEVHSSTQIDFNATSTMNIDMDISVIDDLNCTDTELQDMDMNETIQEETPVKTEINNNIEVKTEPKDKTTEDRRVKFEPNKIIKIEKEEK